jgi:hypothetical protein
MEVADFDVLLDDLIATMEKSPIELGLFHTLHIKFYCFMDRKSFDSDRMVRK